VLTASITCVAARTKTFADLTPLLPWQTKIQSNWPMLTSLLVTPDSNPKLQMKPSKSGVNGGTTRPQTARCSSLLPDRNRNSWLRKCRDVPLLIDNRTGQLLLARSKRLHPPIPGYRVLLSHRTQFDIHLRKGRVIRPARIVTSQRRRRQSPRRLAVESHPSKRETRVAKRPVENQAQILCTISPRKVSGKIV
jgi:hypothetical protein